MAWLVAVVGPWHSLLSLVVPLLHLACDWHSLSRPGDPLSPAPGEQPDFGHLQLGRSCRGAESAASHRVCGDLQHKGLCLGKATSLSSWRVYFLFLTDTGGAPGTVVTLQW